MSWRIFNQTFDTRHRALVMGVLNVTPDSFSDGGLYQRPDLAVARGLALVEEGADILDIGGESTRPGAAPVSLEEELRRVLPVVEALASRCKTIISIDTYKPEVALQAVQKGAAIINDINGLRDPEMLEVVRRTGAAAIAMHMQGRPETMQKAPYYENVVHEVSDFFGETLRRCVAAEIPAERLALDPGIGFGKTVAHNLELLQQLEAFHVHGRPLVLGVSRKSFLGTVTGLTSVADRDRATVTFNCEARRRGGGVFRVHAVRPNVEALRETEGLLGACA